MLTRLSDSDVSPAPWLTAYMLIGEVNKLILRTGDSPCEGHLYVYHKDEWRYVGDKNWKSSTEKVVCRSTHCGEPVSSEEVLRPLGTKVWLNDLSCKGNESHLWDCENPGWGKSHFRKDTMRWIKCSSKAWLFSLWNIYTLLRYSPNTNFHDDDFKYGEILTYAPPPLDKIKISLDESKCAGAVRYSTDGENYSGYICADNWGKTYGSALHLQKENCEVFF